METAGEMMELLEAQDTGYLPASMGVFTILTTDTGVSVCAAEYQLYLPFSLLLSDLEQLPIKEFCLAWTEVGG